MIIIEFCEESILIAREQYYLDSYQVYKREIGYNISEIAGKVCIERAKFKLFSPKGKLIEGRNLRRFCRENSLSIQTFNRYYNQRKKRKGGVLGGGWRIFDENLHPNRDLTSDEIEELRREDYEKRYAYQRKVYRFLVNGIEIEIKNLKEYADKNGLDKNILSDTYRKNTIPYKGHISLLNEKIVQKQMAYKGQKVHFLISDNKELLKIFNLRAFCKEKAVNRVFLKKMSRKNLMYKGYFILALNIPEMEVSQDYINKIYSEKLKILF